MRLVVVQESDYLERGPHQSHHLLERLAKRGHEIRVIDYPIGWKAQREGRTVTDRKVRDGSFKVMGPGVKVIRPSILRLPILCYTSLAITHRQEISRQIREFRPDAIIGFGILNTNIAIRIAKAHNIPFFYYVIDELHRLVPEKPLQSIARLLESRNMEEADTVISINESLRDYTIRMGANPNKTEVIRAGVDLETFKSGDRDAIRAKYGIRDDEKVLFFMGWLYEFSGLKEVAEELAKKRNRKIKLLILGKGDLWDTLQEIRSTYGMEDKIIMEPWVPYQDVPKYIMAADICVLPAYKNDIMMNIVPIKMYEYMAAGKPVLTTGLPGIIKEFGTTNGVTYADSSRAVLDKAIELIESGAISSEGIKARNFVKPLSWDKLTDLFQQTLNKGMLSG